MAPSLRPRFGSGGRSLVAAFAGLLVVFALVAVAWIAVFDLGGPGGSSGGSKYQDWGVISAFVVGSAVALAVAWATVRLADAAVQVSGKALEMSRAADRREARVFIEQRLAEVTHDFMTLSLALEDCIASLIPLYESVDSKSDRSGLVGDPARAAELGEDLTVMKPRISAALRALASALAQLQMRPTARVLSQLALRRSGGGLLKWLFDRPHVALPSGLTTMSSDDLAEVRSLLNIAADRVEKLDVDTTVTYKRLADLQSGGLTNLSMMLLAGHLVFSFGERDGDDARVIAIGAALLADLRHMLPSTETVAAGLADDYSELGIGADEIAARLPGDAPFAPGRSVVTYLDAMDANPRALALPTLA